MFVVRPDGVQFVAEAGLIAAGQQPGPAGRAIGGRHVALREPHAVGGEGVEVRRRHGPDSAVGDGLRAGPVLEAAFAPAEVVRDDQQDVRPVDGPLRRDRPRRRSGRRVRPRTRDRPRASGRTAGRTNERMRTLRSTGRAGIMVASPVASRTPRRLHVPTRFPPPPRSVRPPRRGRGVPRSAVGRHADGRAGVRSERPGAAGFAGRPRRPRRGRRRRPTGCRRTASTPVGSPRFRALRGRRRRTIAPRPGRPTATSHSAPSNPAVAPQIPGAGTLGTADPRLVPGVGGRPGFDPDDSPVLLGVSGTNTDAGVLVTGVVPGTPAARAGLERGDRVLTVAGMQVGYVNTPTGRQVYPLGVELARRLGPTGEAVLLVQDHRTGQITTVGVRPVPRYGPANPPGYPAPYETGSGYGGRYDGGLGTGGSIYGPDTGFGTGVRPLDPNRYDPNQYNPTRYDRDRYDGGRFDPYGRDGLPRR